MKKFFIYVFAAATLGVLLIVGLFSKNVVSNPVAHYDLSKTKIAYVVRDEGGTFIYVINPDGSNKTKLTAGSMPYWSSFGKKIAYAADKDGNRDIYYMDEDGSNITRLTSHPDGHVNPAWSPDGTKIV